MKPTLLVFLLSIFAISDARADGSITLRSVDGTATIELSCDGGKKLALSIKTRPRAPVVRPGGPSVGVLRAGVVQYTFDGAALSREEWLRQEDGLVPRDEMQLRAFAQRLFVAHVLHLGVGGLQASEFQLDREATRLREFAQTCVRP